MARSGPTKTRTRPSGAHRARKKPLDDEGIIPILARAVREVESARWPGQSDRSKPHQVSSRGVADQGMNARGPRNPRRLPLLQSRKFSSAWTD